MQGNGQQEQSANGFFFNAHEMATLPGTLRELHRHLPLAGDPENALLSLPDDLLTYLISAIRNTPCMPLDLTPEEWHTFLSLLRPHWIFPLVTFHVQTWPEACRPPREIMEYLNKNFQTASARTLLAGVQIQAVANAMRDAGIPVILLKGHALARTVYPDPALRQSSDIDMLVQPHNFPVAEAVLEKLGYSCPAKIFHIYPYGDHHEKFFPPGNKGLRLQLHWATDNEFGLFAEGWLDEAFSRRITIQAGNLSFDTFCDADQLLYLVFHDAFQHRSIRLDWV
ncbi:MAG: nucleotidyltransferase family protein, partial [Methanoregula sp.]|nr:nucleotidyltransferase family protein [Methanoregula sp.]